MGDYGAWVDKSVSGTGCDESAGSGTEWCAGWCDDASSPSASGYLADSTGGNVASDMMEWGSDEVASADVGAEGE